MFTTLDLILLRHAETNHESFKQSTSNQNHLNTSLIPSLHLNEAFHIKDRHISEQGVNHCREIAETLNWENIGLIIVSPLRRCLDTCRMLLKYSKQNVQVFVEPLLTDRLTSAQSSGSSRKELEAQYPQFCFSYLEKSQKLPWYLNVLNNSTLKRILSTKNPCKFYQHGVKQTQFEFKDRVERFKKILSQHLGKYEGKRILIISHNKVFSTMTAKFFTDEGRSVSDYKFSCGQIKYVNSCQLFHPLCPSAKL